jgi:hypothetical protein
MPGGGFLTLVAYGTQNVALSGNPQISYFYKAFKRYTHFAMETIRVSPDGPNELRFDQPTQLRAKIPRQGDLMSDMYFTFQLPPIFSKYIEPNTVPGRTAQYEFQWVRYIGAAIIQNAAFFVGGQKIQEFDGNYLLSRALIDMDQDTFHKWEQLVGNVPELTDPAKGLYAGGTTQTAYPTVVKNPALAAGVPQGNRPSIFGRTIYVPLSFWFTESSSLALPLVGLQYHECQVQLTLNPIQNLYTILDASGYRVNPTYAMLAPTQEIALNKPEYASVTDLSGQIRNFLTDINETTQLNTWNYQPNLQITYIYLPDEERNIFASRPLSYIMNQITPYPFQGLYQRQILDMETHNPITRMIFVQRRSDAINRNDVANFTNWYAYPTAPFQVTPGLPPNLQAICSGVPVPNAQEEIIRAIRIICNGNEIQEEKPVEFFTRLTPYKYTKGLGQTGLPVYTFELSRSPTQPSGSINASRIRNFQVDLDLYPLPTNTTYTYDVVIYVENLNWFQIASGMGGLKYAL